jgi:GNAT superfamily N-acetyltransferase
MSSHLREHDPPAHVHVTVTHTRPEHVAALAAAQRLAFPTLVEAELLTEAKYLKHIELFPEGQFVALAHVDGQEIPIGSTSTFRTNFDFINVKHTFLEAIADGWLTNHEPDGRWLYGADMSVHPAFRGLRIGRRLYEARRALVLRLNLCGEIAGGLIPGYHRYGGELTIAQYILRVHQDKLYDPTLSMQLRNGFRVRGVLYDHISDSRSNNAATLIVRENSYYRPEA